MQEAFDKLSPEEIDLLNSDPQMLSDFKKKYGSPEVKAPAVDPIKVAQNLQSNTMSMNPNIPMPAPVNLTGNVPSVSPNEVGHNIGSITAEELAKRGVNPYVSALAGMPASMAAPTAEMGYNVAMMGGPRGIAEALGSAGKGIAGLARGGVDKLRNLARIMTGPGQASQELAAIPLRNAAKDFVIEAQQGLNEARQIPPELAQARAELPQMQARMAQLGPQREALVAKAGKNIQSLESGLGDLESQKIQMLVNNPEGRQATLKQLTALTSKGPDAVNAKMTAMDIRQMRQFVQEVARNPEIAIEAPQASQINTVLGQAMDKHIPGYKDALDVYKEAQAALEDVPNVKAQQLGELRSKIKSMQDTFTNTQRSAADNLKRAQLNARQIIQKADMMVQQGKLSDVYRQRLYKGILATGILGGVGKIAKIVGGQ